MTLHHKYPHILKMGQGPQGQHGQKGPHGEGDGERGDQGSTGIPGKSGAPDCKANPSLEGCEKVRCILPQSANNSLSGPYIVNK